MSKFKCLIFVVLFGGLIPIHVEAQDVAIDKGVQWLKDTQSSNGCWGTETVYPSTLFRDTCLIADTLCYLNLLDTPTINVVNWITSQDTTCIRQLARKINTLATFGTQTTPLIGTLTLAQNSDGGWGINKGFKSTILNTILVLKALCMANYSDTTIINNAISYISANQNPDGSWGFTSESGSNIYLTALVLLVLNQYRLDFYVEPAIDKAVEWLISQQNADGSFRNSIWETALAYSAIANCGLRIADLEKTLEYILDAQDEDGSWNQDAYTTALALRALKDSAPDLAISWQDITFEPEVPVEGEPVTIKATIWNYGGTPVKDVEGVISHQSLAIGEIEDGGSATVSLVGTFTAGTHKIVVEVDPANQIKERDETNNIAEKNLTVATLPDLTASISFNPINPQEGDVVAIKVIVYNLGESAAKDVVVELYDGNPAENGYELGTSTCALLPGGAQAELTLDYGPLPAGIYDIYVVVDPAKSIVESNKANNIISKTLTVKGTPTISAPTGLIAIPGNSMIDLSWNANPEGNLAGYNLYRNGVKINTALIISTNYRDTGLINGLIYTYTVTAVDKEGNESEHSASVCATPQGYYINPPTITFPTIAGTPIWVNTTPITISGKTEPNIEVEVFANGISFGITMADDDGTFTFTGVGLIEGTNTITVVAIKDSYRSQPSLPIVIILDTTPPQAPTGLKATPGNKFVYLNWTANTESDLAGYNIYRDGSKINPTIIVGTLYWDIGLTNGQEYAYRITALDKAGNESEKSIEAKATPSEVLPEVKVGVVGHFYMEVANRLNSNELPIVGVTEQNYIYEHLKDYEVIVVTEHDYKITTQEAEAIREYLNKGGAVFLAQDDIGAEWWIHDIIFPLFGISASTEKHFTAPFTFKNSFFAQGVSDLGSIADPDNDKFELDGAQPLLVDKYEDVFICYQGHKTVLMAEEIYASWDSGGVLDASPGDWIQLFRNIIKWLLMKPDITLSESDISFSNSNPIEGEYLTITAIIHNIGELEANDIWLNFYDGNPADGGILIGTKTIATILPHSTETAQINWVSTIGIHNIYVVVDPLDTIKEMNETNNFASVSITVISGMVPKPDLSIGKDDITFSPSQPTEGKPVVITSVVHNQGGISANNVVVQFFDGNPDIPGSNEIGVSNISQILAGGVATAQITWDTLSQSGQNYIYVIVDPDNLIDESNEVNNITHKAIDIAIPDKPDLSIDSISFSNPTPTEGDEVVITAVVHNYGQEVCGVKVRFSDMGDVVVSSIPLAGTKDVSLIWNTLGNAGEREIIVTADPDSQIEELDETNNSYQKTILINPAQFSLRASTNKATYTAFEKVDIQIEVTNLSNLVKDLMAEIEIVDIKGNLVDKVGTVSIAGITPAEQRNYSLIWNTRDVISADYQVKAVLSEVGIPRVQTTDNFAILPVLEIDASVATDKISYSANTDVTILSNIKSQSPNFTFENLVVEIAITNDVGKPIFTDQKPIPILLPEARKDLKSYWNTLTNSAGTYSVTQIVYYQNEPIHQATASFKILSSLESGTGIKGQIGAEPKVVEGPAAFTLNYSLTNIGNIDLGSLTVNKLIIDPETKAVVKTFTEVINLPMGANYGSSLVVETAGLEAKSYLLALQAEAEGKTISIASSYVRVIDIIPPVTTISIGIPNYQETIVSGVTPFTLTSVDNFSGIGYTEYNVDNQSWIRAGIFTLAGYEDGTHTIYYRGVDKAGNTETTKNITVILDTTSPKVELISPSKENVGVCQIFQGTITIFGTIEDIHLEDYKISYAQGTDTPTWTELTKGTVSLIEFKWETSKLTQDSYYTLKVTTEDKVTNLIEDSVVIFIGKPELLTTISYEKGKFHPSYVALDREENIYVTNHSNTGEILKFDSKGGLIEIIGQDEGLNHPEGIAIDSEDNLYVADTNNNRIVKFDKDGRLIMEIGKGFNKPTGVTLDEKGNIYVTDSNNNRILKFNQAGELLIEIGNQLLNKPAGIFVDEQGNIYVADRNNDRVLKFDKEGILQMQIKEDGKFNKPEGIVVNGQGYIYISDTNNNRIKKFDKMGSFVLQWYGLNKPAGIACDNKGNIYVVDRNNQQVKVFGLLE
ncbi:MAG: CARDB domain-containing protein [bacterium]